MSLISKTIEGPIPLELEQCASDVITYPHSRRTAEKLLETALKLFKGYFMYLPLVPFKADLIFSDEVSNTHYAMVFSRKLRIWDVSSLQVNVLTPQHNTRVSIYCGRTVGNFRVHPAYVYLDQLLLDEGRMGESREYFID